MTATDTARSSSWRWRTLVLGVIVGWFLAIAGGTAFYGDVKLPKGPEGRGPATLPVGPIGRGPAPD